MKLALVAGEASGDLLAGLLLAGIRKRWPEVATAGIGGPKMAEQGFEAWWPHEKLAVRGYVEVLRHYREIKGIRDALADRLLRERPAAFIGVDAPDFNLGLEKRLKAAGIKTVHFVCPSIWAWRGGRAKKMAASVDHVLCLFPFEPAICCSKHGIAASYVGHPLADAIPLEPPRAASRRGAGAGRGRRGGRRAAGQPPQRDPVHRPGLPAGGGLLRRQRPALKFVLPMSRRPARDAGAAAAASTRRACRCSVLDGQSHAALAACDVTLIASGTATLEAALFKRPMVIGYDMHPLSWMLMKRMRYQPWVGCPTSWPRVPGA